VLGLTPSTSADHAATALGALELGLRSFHRGGEPSVTGRITQVPLVEIVEPFDGTALSDPASILLRWKTTFSRFDGQAYTSSYPPGFEEPEADLEYSVLYSRDEGATWRYALNSQPAQAGQRPSSGALLLDDASAGTESLVLPTPSSSYVGAEYLFRVECYHKTRRSHLSSHQVRLLLTRS